MKKRAHCIPCSCWWCIMLLLANDSGYDLKGLKRHSLFHLYFTLCFVTFKLFSGWDKQIMSASEALLSGFILISLFINVCVCMWAILPSLLFFISFFSKHPGFEKHHISKGFLTLFGAYILYRQYESQTGNIVLYEGPDSSNPQAPISVMYSMMSTMAVHPCNGCVL